MKTRARGQYTFLLSVLLLIVACNKTVQTETAITGKTFVVLGSSTAFGVGATSLDSSWIGLLAAKFKADKSSIKLINLAQSTYTTYHILPTSMLKPSGKPAPDSLRNITKALSLHPDFVIINLPSNDISNGFGDSEILENYRKVTSVMIENNIPFILTSTQPRNLPKFSNRERLKDFNNKLSIIYPFNVEDYYNALADDSLYIKQWLDSGSGIHLNNRGHRIIFEHLCSNPVLIRSAGL